MKLSPFFIAFFICISGLVNAQSDLELNSFIDDPTPEIYTTFVAEFSIINTGEAADSIVVTFVIPSSLRLVGQGEGFVTQGTFEPYLNTWQVGSLAVGESATLYMNLFNLTGTQKEVYAQVDYHSGLDIDSSPGNGTPPAVNEDDELALTINPSPDPSCEVDLQIGTGVCDDAGTLDALDDYYSVDILVEAITGDTAIIRVGSDVFEVAENATLQLSDQLISNGPLSIAIRSKSDSSCFTLRTVQPPLSCSDSSVGCAGNLLFNGSFESGSIGQGWTTVGRFSATRISPNAIDGNNAYRLEGNYFSGLYQSVDALPGQTYSVSANIFKEFLSVEGSFQLKFLSSNWQVLGTESDNVGSLNTGYQLATLEAVSPAQTAHIEIRFERYGGVGEMLIDVVCLSGAQFDPCANDDTPPIINFCPQDIVVIAPQGAADASASWVPPFGTDRCSDTIYISSSAEPGDVFPLGSTEVVYTLRDEAGNENSCSFFVRINPANQAISDLSITRILPIFTIIPGRNFRIGLTISNNGSEPIGSGIEVAAYLSTDPIFSADDLEIGRNSLTGAEPSRTDIFFNSLAPTTVPYGEYTVFLKVDDTDQLVESNESNNVKSVPASVNSFCFGRSDFPWHEWISEVTFDDFTQTSGKSIYTSNTAQSLVYSGGEDVDYRFETTFSFSTYTPHYSVYIDANQDGTLEASELWFQEIAPRPDFGAGATTSVSGTVVMPVNLPLGIHRLRVIMSRDSFATFPCGSIDYGEVEDYMLEIVTPPVFLIRRNGIASSDKMRVSPNPTSGYFQLQLPQLSSQSIQVNLVNGVGQTVEKYERSHTEGAVLNFSLSQNLPSAYYKLVVIPERGQVQSVPILIFRE